MGVSVSVYVGPFVKLQLTPTKYIDHVLGCPKPTCSKFGNSTQAKFCPECGTKVDNIDVPREGVLCWNSFNEATDYKYEGDLHSPEYLGNDDEEILISQGKAGRYVDVDDGTPFMFSDMSSTVADEIIVFKTEYEELFIEMFEFFGDNLTIEFGVCAYWS
jgi:hypothetical protein